MLDRDPSTIVAICTPRGRGGIGMVRLSGDEALAIGRSLFHSRPRLGGRARHVTHGQVVDHLDRPVDAAMAWYLSGPGTYTGEDVVEITTHGSDAVLDLVVDRARQLGARQALPGEFTRRAFLHGRIDLLQAEAVADLIHAKSQGGLRAAYGVLGGDLSRRVRVLREDVVDVLARLEGMLDFSDDVSAAELGDMESALAGVEERAVGLVASFSGARSRLQGFTVVLAGLPNAGKSTLLNALLGEERSIVTDIPGTTRDWVEGFTTWSGEAVRLVDTAGLVESEDAVEQAGVRSSRQQLAAADLVLHVIDGSAGPTSSPYEPVEVGALARVTVLSKADLPPSDGLDISGEALRVSAKTGQGLPRLREAVLRHLPGRGEDEGAVPLRERHRDALSSVAAATAQTRQLLSENSWEVAATELHGALRCIGELLGETADDAVLDRIFAQFCIGK